MNDTTLRHDEALELPKVRSDIIWAHPCPICWTEAEPGEVYGWYTDHGLRIHLMEVHGEAT
jgi:hypothetical protein